MGNLIKYIVKILSKKNLEWEIFSQRISQRVFSLNEEKLEDFTEEEDEGIGIRLFKKGKVGFSSTNIITKSSMERLVENAMENLTFYPDDEFMSLPDEKKYFSQDLVILNRDQINKSSLKKLAALKENEKFAHSYDKKIKKVLSTSYSEQHKLTKLINSNGYNNETESSSYSFSVSLLFEENNDTQIGNDFSLKRDFNDIEIEGIIKNACFRGKSLLGSKKIQSMKTKAVFSPLVATEFLDIIAGCLSAERISKRQSFFTDKRETKITKNNFILIDDATIKKGMGSYYFDGEGIIPQKKFIIKNGILKNYLYNYFYAKKENRTSTGNAVRSYNTMPSIAPSNFFIQNGNLSEEEIISLTDDGIFIIEVMGLHTVDTVSGEFSLGASGIRIKNGNLTYPFRGVTISGNLLKWLKDIDLIGNNLTFYGNIGSPTLRIKEIQISGN